MKPLAAMPGCAASVSPSVGSVPHLQVIFTENGDWLRLVGFAALDRAATDHNAFGLSRA